MFNSDLRYSQRIFSAGAFPAPPLVRPELTAEEVQLAKGAFAMLKLSLPDVCGVPDDEDDDGEPLSHGLHTGDILVI